MVHHFPVSDALARKHNRLKVQQARALQELHELIRMPICETMDVLYQDWRREGVRNVHARLEEKIKYHRSLQVQYPQLIDEHAKKTAQCIKKPDKIKVLNKIRAQARLNPEALDQMLMAYMDYTNQPVDRRLNEDEKEFLTLLGTYVVRAQENGYFSSTPKDAPAGSAWADNIKRSDSEQARG